MQRFFMISMVLGLALPPVSHAVAQEQPTVVLLAFTGPSGSAARTQALRALKGKVKFKRQADAVAIAKTLNTSLDEVKGRKLVATEMGIDYIFWGSVVGQGAKRRTEIRVGDASGKEVTAYAAPPPGTQTNNAMIGKAARQALEDAMKESPPVAVVPRAETPTPAKPPPSKTAEPTRVDEAKAAPPVFVVLVGAGGRVRNVTVNLDDNTERKYDSNLYLELAGQFQIRPGARSDKAKLHGLYLQLDGALGLGLEATPQGVPVSLGITTYELLGQFGYLAAIGNAEIGGTLGIGWDDFSIEENPILSSTRYLYARAAFIAKYNFIKRLFYGRIDAGFRYPFSLGELATTFGSDASALGFDVQLWLGGELDVGFTYMARAMYEQYNLKFSGAGCTPNPPNSCLAGATGTDGTDHAISFQLLVGWSI